jgi:peptide-methionine (S)-S-oxide reductase
VGYAGGTKLNPTYHAMGDHTESFQVDYDPAVITYDQLLDLFWESHNPCDQGYSRQYMSAVFAGSEEQKRAAEESKARLEKKIGQTVRTPILPLGKFTLAEDYHQKYYLRNSQVMREFDAIYPDAKAFTDSTAAARANGFMAGDGDPEFVKSEVEKLGLSSPSKTALLRAAGIH